MKKFKNLFINKNSKNIFTKDNIVNDFNKYENQLGVWNFFRND